jgi:hypothetical protein
LFKFSSSDAPDEIRLIGLPEAFLSRKRVAAVDVISSTSTVLLALRR